ncbi:MAG: hypothetical protein F6K54_36840 [Okeania sp. SIO3B5]|nr:hypothetical protein [Okeania sp. SIO3B5]
MPIILEEGRRQKGKLIMDSNSKQFSVPFRRWGIKPATEKIILEKYV